MLGWIIVIVLLLLILIMPVGVSAAYDSGGFSLRVKLGPAGIRIFPRKKAKQPKPKKEKKPKREKAGKQDKPKKKLSFGDLRPLAQTALRALHRFRLHLSIDVLRLRVVAASSDPYDAVMLYGRVNAGLGILIPEAHKVLNIRDELVTTDVDLASQKLSVEGKITATLQIWEILLIVNCAGAALLAWLFRRRKQARAAAKVQNRKELE